ncbi:peptidase S8/S53 domain-containing protein [Rhypophila decipiens]|uniref:Peptidase S8/S53 domain-containing protein n=1 Tax=Rhypophila decipiens TaxID=261697 RepID=A0AAN6Y4H4_9PEZI|nr:peptidase S8/S53 domain-containing protein [Rhypophila decipiens]
MHLWLHCSNWSPRPTSSCSSQRGFMEKSPSLKAHTTGLAPAHGPLNGLSISVNGQNLSPESQKAGGVMFKESASGSNYLLIQFAELPDAEQEAALRTLRVQFCRIIHPNSWLARFKPTDLSTVRQLPFVIYANAYHAHLRLPPGFSSALVEEIRHRPGPAELHEVLISLHPGGISPEDMRSYLVSNLGISRDNLFLRLQGLSGSLRAEDILRVAKLDHVAIVEKEGVAEPHCHLTEGVINLVTARATAREQLVGNTSSSLTGQGEIICIADSGFDRGVAEGDTVHPSFTGRVLKLDSRVPNTRRGVVKCNDLSGHGTHIAGIALGRYEKMASQERIKLTGPSLNGIAPGASMIMQKVMELDPATNRLIVRLGRRDYAQERLLLDPYYGYPAQYTHADGWLIPARPRSVNAQRVKIHNHSFGRDPGIGDGYRVGYNSDAFDLDHIIFTAPELCLIQAAGNNGRDPAIKKYFHWTSGQINSAASAKNVITVGACFNGQTHLPPGTPDGPKPVAAEHMPLFSSRGPTICAQGQTGHGKTIKPDVVAPGVAIYSARSQAQIGDWSSPTAPISDDRLFSLHDGTSMSAAVVSGSVALFSQALKARGFPSPSAALIKALTINGAVDLSIPDPKAGRTAGMLIVDVPDLDYFGDACNPPPLTEAPDDIQGFGRIDVGDSTENILDTKLAGMVDAGADPRLPSTDPLGPIGLPGAVKRYEVRIPPPPDWAKVSATAAVHLKATLAFIDYPGEGLQNQLALSIECSDPALAKKKNTSVRDPGDARKDRMFNNNVQKLIVRDIGQFVDEQTPILANVVVTSIRICDNPWTKKKCPLPFAVCWKVWYTGHEP